MIYISTTFSLLWLSSGLPISNSESQGILFPSVSQYLVSCITEMRYLAGKYHYTTHLGFPPTEMWAFGEGTEEEWYAPHLVLMYCWDGRKALPRLSWEVLLLNCSSDRTLSYVSYKLFTVFAAPHIFERAMSFTVALLNVLLDDESH